MDFSVVVALAAALLWAGFCRILGTLPCDTTTGCGVLGGTDNLGSTSVI